MSPTSPRDQAPVGDDARGARRRQESALRELGRFLPDVARLLYALARDPRVPWQVKAVSVGAVAYVLSPVDLVPDPFGKVGVIDDLWVTAKAVRFMVQRAGYDVVRELWPGSEDGFALLLVAAGIER